MFMIGPQPYLSKQGFKGVHPLNMKILTPYNGGQNLNTIDPFKLHFKEKNFGCWLKKTCGFEVQSPQRLLPGEKWQMARLQKVE